MTHSKPDRNIENTIGNLLRAGVVLSTVIVLSGAIIYLWRHGLSPAEYQVFRPQPPELSTVWGIVRSAGSLRGRAIIQLGLLILIATPVARVVFTIWGFAVSRDKTYVLVACFVLCALLFGLFGSALGI